MHSKQITVRINPEAKKIIETYAKIHEWSMPRFFDNLALLLADGLDGMTEFDLDTLKRLYKFSSLQIVADLRKVTKF